MRLHRPRQVGHGPGLVGVDGPLGCGPADGLVPAHDPLVRRGLARDQPVTEAADGAHERFRAVAGDGVGGEGHARGLGGDEALDQDGHAAGARVPRPGR